MLHCTLTCVGVLRWQVSSIPKIRSDGSLNYSFTIYVISYFVVVNWTLLQVCRRFLRGLGHCSF